MAAASRAAALLAVGELVLTPRGLLALGQRSLRSVRLQVKALEDVGEELVKGGREVLGAKTQAAKSELALKPRPNSA